MEIKIVGKRILEEDLNGLLVKGEAGIETVELLLEKNYRGLDLSKLNFTLFMRSAKGGVLTSTVLAKTIDGDNLRLAWKIGRDFTSTAGAAQIEISGMDGSGTAIFKAVSKQFSVLDNIESGSNLPPKDVIEQALEDMQVNLSEAAERVADVAGWANRAKGYSDQAKQSAATVDTKVQAAQDVTNALTAATGTANSSNTTLQTAINQAKAALKNLQDAIGEAELENYLSATGTAVAAKKLETAREIALTGVVTGSGEFDGSGNLNISTIGRSCIVGRCGQTDENYWYKFAACVNSYNYSDIRGTFLITNTRKLYKCVGILIVYARYNTPVTNIESVTAEWVYTTPGIDISDFVVAYAPKTATSPNLELWVKVTEGNETYQITILDEGNFFQNSTPKYIWSLYNSLNTGVSSPTEGYTQVPSTYSYLKTGEIFAQGGMVEGEFKIGKQVTPNQIRSYMQYLITGDNEGIRFFAVHNDSSKPHIYISTLANESIKLVGIDDPETPNSAANKRYIDAQIAALETKLTGNTVAASVPNEAPTLEAPGEEEITV